MFITIFGSLEAWVSISSQESKLIDSTLNTNINSVQF